MIRVGVTLLSCGLILGCGQPIEYPLSSTPIELLQGEEVVSTEIITTGGYWIEADPQTGRLVTLDYLADAPVVVFDTTGRVLARLGARGEGPGEVKDTRSLNVFQGTGYVWDRSQNRYGWFDMESPIELTTATLETELPLIWEVQPLSSGGLFVTGSMGTNLAVKVESGEAAPWGGSPAVLQRVAGEDERLQRFFSKAAAAVNEAADVVALGYYHTAEMVFARLSTGEIISETLPGNWADPRLSRKYQRRGIMEMTEDSFLGYRTVKATPEAAWALCVCNTANRANKSFPYTRRDVHYYSWSGELVRIYRLSRSVEDIAVLGGYLYATVNEPLPAVVRWKLPAS